VEAEKQRKPGYRGSFKPGIAGETGEIYWSIGVLQGRHLSIAKDPRTGDHPVFKDTKIAEKVVADLEKMRDDGEFPDVTKFVVTRLEVGKPSKVERPNAGLILPSSVDVSKYGGKA